ncbi:MAG: hypothetical protein KBE65_11330 [Phycisphaerae bacterium]|nr:hypothetical protein [Phycisphaerae bacterium]
METSICHAETALTPLRKAKCGRPTVWTDEVIEEKAKSLLAYFENPDSLFLEAWCAQEKLRVEYVSQWAAQNEVFADALALVSTTQCARLLEGGVHNKLNSKVVSLVLQSRHGFNPRSDVTLRAAEPTEEDEVRQQAQTLVRVLPSAPAEARIQLQELRSADQIGQRTVDETLRLIDLLERARQTETGIVE